MGYDVTVKFKNEERRSQMKSFLNQNMNLLKEMSECDIYMAPHDMIPYDGEDLGYAPKKKFLLGFHGSGIPNYIWNLCAWMSVKAECKNKDDFYFYYDDEQMKVTMNKENSKDTVVDENGIKIINKESDSITKKLYKFISNYDEKIKKQNELFIKLNENWNEFNNNLIKKSKHNI